MHIYANQHKKHAQRQHPSPDCRHGVSLPIPTPHCLLQVFNSGKLMIQHKPYRGLALITQSFRGTACGGIMTRLSHCIPCHYKEGLRARENRLFTVHPKDLNTFCTHQCAHSLTNQIHARQPPTFGCRRDDPGTQRESSWQCHVSGDCFAMTGHSG